MDEDERGPGIDKDDAAELTNSSPAETSGAWHDARDDAQAAGDIERGSGSGESHTDTNDVEAQSLC